MTEDEVNLQPYLNRVFQLEDALKGFTEMVTDKEDVLKVILKP